MEFEILYLIFGAILAVGMILVAEKYQGNESSAKLFEWAKCQELEIIESDAKRYSRGLFGITPFKFGASHVFYIKVKGESGKIQTGWIKFSDSLGLDPDKVEIIWDK